MWFRCLVVIAFIIAVPWTIFARVCEAAGILWFGLRSDLSAEWRDAKRCWRDKTFN